MELTSEISADPLSVAIALVAEGLIPESSLNFVQLQTVRKDEKASELVSLVTNKVKTFPVAFDEFLKVLGGFIWLKKILEFITEVHDKLKSQDKEGGNVSEDAAPFTAGMYVCYEPSVNYNKMYSQSRPRLLFINTSLSFKYHM